MPQPSIETTLVVHTNEPPALDASKPIVKLNNAHRGALQRAKLKPFRLYDCRHTFATRAAEAGVDLVTLAALLGHSRVQMVMRYAHPTEEHQFNAMKKMEAYEESERLIGNELQMPTTFPTTVGF
jgi:integrase